MPGNQGGSNWGTTAANPEKGLVFVVNVNQVALLKLEDVKTRRREGAESGPSPEVGAGVYRDNCQLCHGTNLQGGGAGVPSLVGVTDRMSEDAIRAIITGGRGLMRPVPGLSGDQMSSLVSFLALTNPNRTAGGRGVADAESAARSSRRPWRCATADAARARPRHAVSGRRRKRRQLRISGSRRGAAHAVHE